MAGGSTRECALVTGASVGIGREIASELAARGYDLVLVARSEGKLVALARELEERHRVRALVFAADLATGDGPSSVQRAVRDAGLEIDLLVNNAGVMHYGPFAEQQTDRHLQVLHLNVVALTTMTSLFVPAMVARGRGRILNVASVAAFQPAPMLAVYGATKAYVLSLTEALSAELSGTGVTVTAACPGFVATPMLEGLADELGQDMVPGFLKLDPVEVAREAVDACLAGTTIHVSGLVYRLMLLVENFQPRWIIRTVGGAMARAFRPAPKTPG